MSLTYTRISGGEGSWGQLRFKVFDVLWDSSYPTGGEALSPAMIGLQNIVGAIPVGAADATSGGIVPLFIPGATPKLMAMRTGTVTPAGTISAPTITVAEGAVTVVGGGIGEAIGINPDSNAGVLSKAAATTRTIPRATLLGSATTATSSTPTFTGAATSQGALAEVSNTTSLATVTSRLLFIGN